MSITQFDKYNLYKVRVYLESALDAVEKQTGLSIELGPCSFRSNTATFKIEIKTVNEDGEAFDEDAANFKVFAEDLGLKEEYLGRTFVSKDTEYTICGLKPRNRKYPILATRADGKRFKFPARIVKRILEGLI